MHSNGYETTPPEREATSVPTGRVLAGRALIGWMSRDEAIRFLTEDCIFPVPMSPEEAAKIWESRREVTEALAKENPLPRSSSLPLTAADLKVARQFRSTHVEAKSITDVVRLNPMNLVIHQYWISTTIADEFRDEVTASRWPTTALVDPPIRTRLAWRQEGNALLVDLPHFEYFLAGPALPDGRMWICEADPFVTVSLHAGRALLLKGYHRTFAFADRAARTELDSAGALFGQSSSLQEMGSDAAEMLQVMEGPRPPCLGDFFDERLFMPVTLRRHEYEMRIGYEVVEGDAGMAG